MGTPPPDLPDDLRAFLFSCIDAAEQVEMLIRLRDSERAWSVRDVAAALLLGDNITRAHLESLVARGLLQVAVGRETTYRYAPKSPHLQRCGALLAEYYGTARSSVLGFVTASSRSGIRTFANAFKLRDPDA